MKCMHTITAVFLYFTLNQVWSAKLSVHTQGQPVGNSAATDSHHQGGIPQQEKDLANRGNFATGDEAEEAIRRINEFFNTLFADGRVPEGVPIMSEVPSNLEFSCKDRLPGFYADVDYQCQVYHVCTEAGDRHSFLCPNGTIFSQKYFACDWWFNFECTQAPVLYHLNVEIYKDPQPRERRGKALHSPSDERASKSQPTFKLPSIGGEFAQASGVLPSLNLPKSFAFDILVPPFGSKIPMGEATINTDLLPPQVNSFPQVGSQQSHNSIHQTASQDRHQLAGDYIPPNRDYLPPTTESQTPSLEYLPPSGDYLPPTNDLETPAPDYLPPNKGANQPTTDYIPPSGTQSIQPPITDYLPPHPATSTTKVFQPSRTSPGGPALPGDYIPPTNNFKPVPPTQEYLPPV